MGWVLKVGLNLRLSEAVDISTETCMKGCDEGGRDLQLQRPAVPCSCPGPVHAARVVHAAGCSGGDGLALETSGISIEEAGQGCWLCPCDL